ncbi:hypothetical protein [uncultured Desulfosarcina sp.]|nr:hypothetical protein [uncultured Desulfosarcina sp.]
MVLDPINVKPVEKRAHNAHAGNRAILFFVAFLRSRNMRRTGSVNDEPD